MDQKKYKCLSIIDVVCNASTAYNSLYRGLKHLLKIPYFIKYYPNVAGFLIFKTFCLGRSKTLTYVMKKYHKNEWHLCFITQSFTKLLQNVRLINTRILIYRHARGDLKLWNALWFYSIFGYFHTLLTIFHDWIVVYLPNFHRLCA